MLEGIASTHLWNWIQIKYHVVQEIHDEILGDQHLFWWRLDCRWQERIFATYDKFLENWCLDQQLIMGASDGSNMRLGHVAAYDAIHLFFLLLWKHIWLCISRQDNNIALNGNPHLLAMFEVCSDYECSYEHHCI